MTENDRRFDNPYAPPRSDSRLKAGAEEHLRAGGPAKFSTIVCCADLFVSLLFALVASGCGVGLWRIVKGGGDPSPNPNLEFEIALLATTTLTLSVLALGGIVSNVGLLLRKRWALLLAAVKSIFLMAILFCAAVAVIAALPSEGFAVVLLPLLFGAYVGLYALELYRFNRRLAKENSRSNTINLRE